MLMEDPTKAISIRIKNTVKVSIVGQMAKFTMVNSNMVNFTEIVRSPQLRVKL